MSDDRRGLVARLSQSLRHDRNTRSDVLVIGLGRFGTSLAGALVELGYDVLGIDEDSELVQRWASLVTQTLVADGTDVEALRQLGASEFQHAVVAIGDQVEGSVLAVAALVDLGLPDIWAKAASEPHARILERVGAHHVVQPERDMGRRVAHLLSGAVLEYLALDDGFALVEVSAPRVVVGRSLVESELRSRFDVSVVCVKAVGGGFAHAAPDTTIHAGDVLLVAGSREATEAFAQLEKPPVD